MNLTESKASFGLFHNRAAVMIAAAVYALLVLFALPNPAIHHQDENYYLESTRIMLDTGNWLIPYYSGVERINKPILFYWLILPAQWIGGDGFFTIRLASLGAALLLFYCTYCIARQLRHSKEFSMLCVVIVATFDVVYRYAHYAVPEMAFTLMMTAAHLVFLKAFAPNAPAAQRRRYTLVFYAAMGLAFMIKGPAGIVLPLLTGVIYLSVTGRRGEILSLFSWKGGLILLAIILPWYAAVAASVGLERFADMLSRETVARVASEADPATYYLPVLMGTFLPWSLFALAGLWQWWRAQRPLAPLLSFEWIWFITYFLFYSLLVGEKQAWYALQWSVPFALLCARSLAPAGQLLPHTGIYAFLAGLGLVVGVLFGAVGYSLGEIVASEAATTAFALTLLAPSVWMLVALFQQWSGFTRFATLAAAAVLTHVVMFQWVFPTSHLRSVPDFVAELRKPAQQYELLTNERYYAKKLYLFEIPHLRVVMQQTNRDTFLYTYQQEDPHFIIASQPFWQTLPVKIQDRYQPVAHGYLKAKSGKGRRVESLIEFLQSGEADVLFDKMLLLRRRDF